MSFKNQIPSPFLEATISVSSAEIQDLVANPKTLIAAPGANKLISVSNITISYTYGTITYSPSQVFVGFSTGTSLGANTILAQTADAALSTSPSLSSNLQSDCVNLPLRLLATSNPLLGDGTIEIQLLYRILDV